MYASSQICRLRDGRGMVRAVISGKIETVRMSWCILIFFSIAEVGRVERCCDEVDKANRTDASECYQRERAPHSKPRRAVLAQGRLVHTLYTQKPTRGGRLSPVQRYLGSPPHLPFLQQYSATAPFASLCHHDHLHGFAGFDYTVTESVLLLLQTGLTNKLCRSATKYRRIASHRAAETSPDTSSQRHLIRRDKAHPAQP